jgi:hypothetical protein
MAANQCLPDSPKCANIRKAFQVPRDGTIVARKGCDRYNPWCMFAVFTMRLMMEHQLITSRADFRQRTVRGEAEFAREYVMALSSNEIGGLNSSKNGKCAIAKYDPEVSIRYNHSVGNGI